MPKPQTKTGQKNLISANLVELRKRHRYSQRILAYKLQLAGYDMDKNVITRIETNKRYVTDIELKALCEIFDVSYDELIDGFAFVLNGENDGAMIQVFNAAAYIDGASPAIATVKVNNAVKFQ